MSTLLTQQSLYLQSMIQIKLRGSKRKKRNTHKIKKKKTISLLKKKLSRANLKMKTFYFYFKTEWITQIKTHVF